jgi:hypothetical protein
MREDEMSMEPFERAQPKARQDGLVVERVGEELLIYDLERDRAHCLNETAALVFEHCDGRHTVGELAARLSDANGDVAEDLVRRALLRLADEQLLEEPVSPPRGREWSRRQIVKRAAVAGAAAGLTLPAVKSIVAPTAAQAQATLPPCACGVDPDSRCVPDPVSGAACACPPSCSCCCGAIVNDQPVVGCATPEGCRGAGGACA